jgi:DNA-binding transcriptional LysR family regulator
MTDLVASPTALDTSIYAMYPPNRHLSPKVRAFVDFLLGKYGNPPYWDVEDPSHE